MAYPYFNAYSGYNAFQQMPMNYPNTQQVSGPVQQAASNGFVRVQNEEEARRYPVAPGGSVTFIDDNSPHCYVKTVDLSPMSAPVFKRFRLVEEETPTTAQNGDISNVPEKGIDLSAYAKIDDIRALRADIDRLRFDVDALGEKSTKKMVQAARKDAENDE